MCNFSMSIQKTSCFNVNCLRVAVCIFFLVFASGMASAQEWHWVQDDRVLNPSGIELTSRETQFQVLDWNGDGRLDFITNDTGVLVYFEHDAMDSLVWHKRDLALPEIGLWNGHPKHFQFLDWDGDGDVDLTADSSAFWWNTGSNQNPEWQADTLLHALGAAFQLSFVDYDADGDWDVTWDEGGDISFSLYGRFSINEGDNQQPQWVAMDSILTDDEINMIGDFPKFVHLNGDNLYDLLVIGPYIGVPGLTVGLVGQINNGSLFQPDWQDYSPIPHLIWQSLHGAFTPAYQVIDFNKDGLPDIVKTDWHSNIEIFLGSGHADSVDFERAMVLGKTKGEASVRPYFYLPDHENTNDLILAENFPSYFGWIIYYDEARIRRFENKQGVFSPSYEQPSGLAMDFPSKYYKNNPTLSFADADNDGDQDCLLSISEVINNNQFVSSEVLYFQNHGSDAAPDWQPDSSRFTFFHASDSAFYDPRLIDIDHDGDLDVLVQKQWRYAFYERLNTSDEQWQENPDWLEGITPAEHHSAVFADLTRDDLADLIFGEKDGTLSFYQNIGSAQSPQWQLVEHAFAGIDVDSLAAPACADLNGDTRLDLMVGNAAGDLVYFRNASTVAVSSDKNPLPTEFRLAQNFPNPFNPTTTISFSVPRQIHVRLSLFDVLGREVAVLVDQAMPAGSHKAVFDATGLASGVYLIRMQAGAFSATKRVMFLK